MANTPFFARHGLNVNNFIQANATHFTIGANVIVTSTSLFIGNSTVNSTHTSALFQVSNSTSTANLDPLKLVIGSSTVNATVISAGANVSLSTSALFIGNSTVNSTHNAVLLQVANSTSTANLDPSKLVIGTSTLNTTSLFLGNSTVNSTHTSALLQLANSTSSANLDPSKLVIGTTTVNSTAISEGDNVILSTTGLQVGNSTVNATINSTSFALNGVAVGGESSSNLIPRAWVTFFGANGTIRSSNGVSSVTRNSAGVYTIAWASSLSSNNYATLISTNSGIDPKAYNNPNATHTSISTFVGGENAGEYTPGDHNTISVAVFKQG